MNQILANSLAASGYPDPVTDIVLYPSSQRTQLLSWIAQRCGVRLARRLLLVCAQPAQSRAGHRLLGGRALDECCLFSGGEQPASLLASAEERFATSECHADL